MNPLVRLAQLGQSVYLDAIGRGMLQDGSLQRLIDEDGIHGVTSNPAIFEKAIAGSSDYRDAMAALAATHADPEAVIEKLSSEDIANAADRFWGLYQSSDRRAGYVSLEVRPTLANDVEATIEEALRLQRELGRPNVFIKVPATRAGVSACEELTAHGVNLNMTLLFSLDRYQEVADAYLRGLERRLANGLALNSSASVASFFLSRIDVAIDPLLERIAATGSDQAAVARALRGEVAIASAKLAFVRYQELFASERFAPLAAAGAQPQWLLWASTGTKDPSYRATKYVEPLIGAPTITTLPQETLDAYRREGNPALRLSEGVDTAEAQLERLASLGIDLAAICDQLEVEGVEKFEKPYASLVQTVSDALAQASR
jgi:transaldolase